MANKEDAQLRLSALWDVRSAVEWRAFPSLRACAVKFHTSSQALEVALKTAGEVT